MIQKNSLKQIYIISEGGKLLYYKDFIGGGSSPEVIAGFLSAFNSFFKEAFKSEPRELLIADQKVLFNKLTDDIIAVILTDDKTNTDSLKPFFQLISREVTLDSKLREINFTDISRVNQRIEALLSEELNKRKEIKVKIKPLSINELKFIISKIRRGLPSFIRVINIGSPIAVLGEEEDVRVVISTLNSMLHYKQGLKVVEYTSRFKNADIIGLPISEKSSIPPNYYILDLSTGVFSPEISTKIYDEIFKKLKPPCDEKILKNIVNYFERLPQVKKAFLNCLSQGDSSKAEKLLEEFTPDVKEIFLDHVISNDSVLRALREYSKYIPIDVLKTFNAHLTVLNNKVFYKNILSVEESLKLIQDLHQNALDYLSESKVKQLKENLKKTLF